MSEGPAISQVGDYRILRVLGEGGMGTVFLAQHMAISQRVAIKSLRPELFQDEEARKRFVREAETLARLAHANIIRLLNYLTHEGRCYIVMELAEGETLAEKLATGIVPVRKLLSWFVPILSALGYAHEHGVLHRDLKPSNILITNEGVPKLLDFGTAKFQDGQQITQPGMTIGTLQYMSKEQLHGLALAASADLYSLGITLYEATTGKLPFDDPNPRVLAARILKERPLPPRSHAPFIPADLERAILRSIEKEARERFASAGEFAAALEAVLAALP